MVDTLDPTERENPRFVSEDEFFEVDNIPLNDCEYCGEWICICETGPYY